MGRHRGSEKNRRAPSSARALRPEWKWRELFARLAAELVWGTDPGSQTVRSLLAQVMPDTAQLLRGVDESKEAGKIEFPRTTMR
jgi:hypothetical protein